MSKVDYWFVTRFGKAIRSFDFERQFMFASVSACNSIRWATFAISGRCQCCTGDDFGFAGLGFVIHFDLDNRLTMPLARIVPLMLSTFLT